MGNRDSQFPYRPSVIRGKPMGGVVRQTVKKRSSDRFNKSPRPTSAAPVPPRIPRTFFLLGLVFLLITFAGPLLQELESVAEQLWRQIQLKPTPETTESLRQQPPRTQMPKRGEERVLPAEGQVSRGENAQGVIKFEVSVGEVFRPVGFVVSARPQRISLNDEPDRLYKRLPQLSGSGAKYGLIELRGGQQYRFVLDMHPQGYRLYVDNNRNGNLSDDGPALSNAGNGRFANKLHFPLAKVTGIPQLKGDYVLWLYVNEGSWNNEQLLAYSRTQLKGKLRLSGKVYDAYLADSHLLDADYTNDGLGIDIDADGKISSAEYLPPEGQIRVANRVYEVRLTR